MQARGRADGSAVQITLMRLNHSGRNDILGLPWLWAIWVLGFAAGLLSTFAGLPLTLQAADAKRVDFNRDILPILSDSCFACHGPDEGQRMANLRLDNQEGLFGERGGYRIVLPGKAAESRMYQKISASEPALRMPPPSSRRTLSTTQIDLIRRWIDEGAPYARHWAFVPPSRPAIPPVRNRQWPRNAIDYFVLSRLESEGLKPSPQADRATLLRRVTLDLTGLPPTLAELESFLADSSPDAYEKRVDRLLASPHYGERMARMWLDLARYADSNGYNLDNLREMWHWRDWVIRAYNQNMPYDQFTMKQLAGDLLPNPTPEDRIATGFNRNHMISPDMQQVRLYHVEYVIDRVRTTGTTWLGLTLGCAQCHDHKYDPIRQQDFYRLLAFFNTIPERGMDGESGNSVPVLPLPSAEQQNRLEELESQINSTLAEIPEKQIIALEAQWRKTGLARVPEPPRDGLTAYYEFEDNLEDTSGQSGKARATSGEVEYSPGPVGKAAALEDVQLEFGKAGDFERDNAFALALWVTPSASRETKILVKHNDETNWRGYEIALEDPTTLGRHRKKLRITVRLASRWPDNAIEITSRDPVLSSSGSHLAVSYDGSGKASGLAVYLDGKWAAMEATKYRLTGSLHTPCPLTTGAKKRGHAFTGRMDDLRIYNRPLTQGEIEQLVVQLPIRRLLAELAERPVPAIDGLQPEARPVEPQIVDKKEPTREEKEAEQLEEQQNRLSEYFLTHEAPEPYRKAYAQLKELRAQRDKLRQSIPTTMVMAEMKEPRDTFVLARGLYNSPTEKVTANVPSFLWPLPKEASPNRLTLAKWLVHPQNPLTARVEVNRYWQSYFGTGIVKTSEDFGMQGERPTHPELLDWLAREFIDSGWNVKSMQRLIVTSAAYRQLSKIRPDLLERDPENRLLAHGPRVRLSAEEIRDQALAVSGLLSDKVGGPSVYPYQPQGLWEEVSPNDGGDAYQPSTGPELYRRSLYTVWKRRVPPPSLAIFDAPDRTKCTARRSVTNTPLQALVLLNDPTYLEASRALAQRAILEGGQDPAKRAEFAFRLATDRNPKPQEQDVLLQIAQQELAHYRQDTAAALKLLSIGEMKGDSKIDPAELAAWTMVARTILNLDETITKQ